MMNLIPDIYQKSIYTIKYDILYENGIRCLLFDLDNTCVPADEKNPPLKLKELFDELKDMGFRVIIFSNATKKRLEPFKDYLLIDTLSNAGKPRSGSFLRIQKKFSLHLSEMAIIGDQLYTDILGGNRVGITTILVNPISSRDQFITKFNRMRENRRMRILSKKELFTKGKYYD